jgi:hypothetical protein
VAALLGHTGHTSTNDASGVLVCHILIFFVENGEEQENVLETQPGQEPRSSKQKASSQQSAPLASTEFVIANAFVN